MSAQGTYWMMTLSFEQATTNGWYPDTWFMANALNVAWYKGQVEIGEGGYKHFQAIFGLKKHKRLSAVRKLFPDGVNPHLELSESKAADDYVWKDDTAVEGTRVEYGMKYIFDY